MMKKALCRFQKDTSGATAIEYGLMAALIAVAMLVGVNALGNGNSGLWTIIDNNVTTSSGG